MTPKTDGPDGPLLLACRDLAREMDLFDDAAARALGIGRNDLSALNLLEHGPLSAAVIADRLHLTRAGVTALVDRLTAAGLAQRSSTATDRRVVMVGLEPATWQAFAGVYSPLGQRVQEATSSLPAEQRALLTAALADIAGAFAGAGRRLAAAAETPA